MYKKTLSTQQYVLIVAALAAVFALVVFLAFRYRISLMFNVPAQQISISTSTIKEDAPAYTINVAYPTFGVVAIDSQVKLSVGHVIADFRAIPPSPTPQIPKNQLDGGFGRVFVAPDVVSAEFMLSQYTGGAHPVNIAIGFNFDSKTGRALTVGDALALIGKSLQQVSDVAIQQLTRQFGSVQFPDGVAPTVNNYSTFVISADKVTFIFQEYQAEAYAVGMPEVEFDRLK